MLAGRDVLVVDDVAILILGQLFLGIGIRYAGTQPIVPLCLSTKFASPYSVVVEIGVRQIGKFVGWRLEIRRSGGEFVLYLIII